MEIRPLMPGDAEAYVRLRREMLLDSPWAFSSSTDDDHASDPAIVRQRLSQPGQAIIGAFDGGLIGSAGIYRQRQGKMSHRAHVWGVYVTPTRRGHGVGERLLRMAMEVAASWPGVTSLSLSASVRSPGAIRLYERVGFRAWGVEPGAIVLDGGAIDEVHMVAWLGG